MSNELLVIETIKPGEVFGSGNVEILLNKIETEVATYDLDVSTKDGRREIASVAHKIARSKTTLDGLGKNLTDEALAKVEAINEERRLIRNRLDVLKAEIRAPLTEFEEKEKERILAHETAINQFTLFAQISNDTSAAEIEAIMKQVYDLYTGHDWQEFLDRAKIIHLEANEKISILYKARQKYEKERAELGRLRAEKEAREAKERDEKIAREAAAEARKEAEAEARKKADEAKARADAERKGAEDRATAAEVARKEAEIKAKRDAEMAVENERRRVEAKRKADKEEVNRREADKNHHAKINREAAAAIQDVGNTTEMASKNVVVAIARGDIPHVKICY